MCSRNAMAAMSAANGSCSTSRRKAKSGCASSARSRSRNPRLSQPSGWATPEPPSPCRPAPARHERHAAEDDQRRRDRQQQHEFGDALAPAAQIADRERHPSPSVEPDEAVAQQRAEARDQQYPPEDAADDHRASIADRGIRADARSLFVVKGESRQIPGGPPFPARFGLV